MNFWFDMISNLGVQAWMTGTDEMIFQSLGKRAQRFNVIDANIKRSVLD